MFQERPDHIPGCGSEVPHKAQTFGLFSPTPLPLFKGKMTKANIGFICTFIINTNFTTAKKRQSFLLFREKLQQLPMQVRVTEPNPTPQCQLDFSDTCSKRAGRSRAPFPRSSDSNNVRKYSSPALPASCTGQVGCQNGRWRLGPGGYWLRC